jgi:fatty acid desaturase
MATLAAIGVVPWQALALWLIVWAGIAVLNTVRTVVAHHYTSDGSPMDPIEQLIDTVTVPPPATFPMLWAPVGLRYHGLHHLLPHLPYHALGTAHRRLIAQLPNTSAYRRTVHARGLDVAALLLRNQAQARAWRARGGSPLPGESPP